VSLAAISWLGIDGVVYAPFPGTGDQRPRAKVGKVTLGRQFSAAPVD
jgi:hypothetical protein